MRTMTRLTIATALLLLMVAVCCPASHSVYWVGFTDLEATFVVTDLATGAPIPHAVLRLSPDPAEGGASARHLRGGRRNISTDVNGVARQVFERCQSWGRHGANVDTFHVAVPALLCDVSAPGYASSSPERLSHAGDIGRPVVRGSSRARLSLPVRLPRTRSPNPPETAGL